MRSRIGQRRVLLAALGLTGAIVAGTVGLALVVQQTPLDPSISPAASESETLHPIGSAASSNPSPEAGFFGPGDAAHFTYGEAAGGFELWLVNLDTRAVVQASTPGGAVLAAALSPDAEWVAYITAEGESGANRVWALRLGDGATFSLGCSAGLPFTNRLSWSPDSLLLAYTLAAVDLGGGLGCAPVEGPEFATDVWMFNIDVADGVSASRYTDSGDAYAASFLPSVSVEGSSALWISHAALEPWSELQEVNGLNAGGIMQREGGVFMPLINPRQRLALFWRPTMERPQPAEGWILTSGGIPLLGSDTWDGDVEPFSGSPILDAGIFADGSVEWGAGGETYVFWSKGWEDDSSLLYVVGHASGPHVRAEVHAEAREFAGSWIQDVAVSADGALVAVLVGLPASTGDRPRSYIVYRNLADGSGDLFGGGEGGWFGPAVFAP